MNELYTQKIFSRQKITLRRLWQILRWKSSPGRIWQGEEKSTNLPVSWRSSRRHNNSLTFLIFVPQKANKWTLQVCSFFTLYSLQKWLNEHNIKSKFMVDIWKDYINSFILLSPLAYSPDSLAVGLARVGTDSEKIAAGSLRQLAGSEDLFGGPLHSLILPSDRLHPLEWEMLAMNAIDESWFRDNRSKYVKDWSTFCIVVERFWWK